MSQSEAHGELPFGGDPAEAYRKWSELAERSQRISAEFMEREAKRLTGHEYSLVDANNLSRAFADWTHQLASNPSKLVEAQAAYWHQALDLWQRFAKAAMGLDEPPKQDIKDRRFKDEAWQESLVHDYIKQSYLLAADYMHGLVDRADGLDPKTREKVAFFTRQFTSAMSPANFALTNPSVLKRVKETGGENLVKGLQHLLDDLEKGRGRLQISMTNEQAFELGKNIATTPGKVVFRNDLIELIQYAPSTETVHKRPLLIVPPWINKFYILDLQPKNSFVKYCVDQGLTVFLISWVNPTKELSHKRFEDYMLEGPLAAMEVIEQATGEKELNILGFCIGGILTSAMLAYMAAKDDKRIKSATLLTSMVDLVDVGEVSVFIDEDQLKLMESHMAEKGYLEGYHLGDMFSMMRENDLIWSFVVNNYLLGRDPLPFDLLYWNSDGTRLPATMLLEYIRKIYMENGLMKPGHVVLDGVPIDLSKITIPIYSLATKEDHIAPWRSCYPVTRAVSGQVRFVLGGSGHIAGVVNPPDRKKYGYWTKESYPETAEAWLDDAKTHEGSWWGDWSPWIKRRAGGEVPARQPGDGQVTILDDAPGQYVRARAMD
ncbi:MAG: PHA/PHB synthase family protein [Geminicoccaceae bacterium]